MKYQIRSWNLKKEINKDCKIIILTLTYRFDNRKAGNTVNELANMPINLNVPIVNSENISRKHLEGFASEQLRFFQVSNEFDLCNQKIVK